MLRGFPILYDIMHSFFFPKRTLSAITNHREQFTGTRHRHQSQSHVFPRVYVDMRKFYFEISRQIYHAVPPMTSHRPAGKFFLKI